MDLSPLIEGKQMRIKKNMQKVKDTGMPIRDYVAWISQFHATVWTVESNNFELQWQIIIWRSISSNFCLMHFSGICHYIGVIPIVFLKMDHSILFKPLLD